MDSWKEEKIKEQQEREKRAQALRKKFKEYQNKVRPKITYEDIQEQEGLDRGTISKLLNGHEEFERPIARTNLVKCIKVFICRRAIHTPEEANELLQIAGFEPLYRESDEDLEVAKLLGKRREELGLVKERTTEKLSHPQPSSTTPREELEAAKLEKQQELDRPRYHTSHTEYIGHQEDINEIITLLLSPHSRIRILTLVGLPGVGKTELAEQIIARDQILEHFSTISIPLRNKKISMAQVIDTILDQVGRSSTDKAKTLVILHDCEVIEDTPNARKELITFLKEQKRVIILATSRRSFQLGYEIEYVHTVPPLKVPNYKDVDTLTFKDLQAYEAVELFRQASTNATANSNTKFTLTEQNIKHVVAICQAFDGLPLALLIAAPLVRHEPIDKIYEWVRENGLLNARYPSDIEWQQSLDLLIGKSYELLREEEKALFRRLSVFVFACNIDAVAAVCKLNNELPIQKDELATRLAALDNYFLITYQDGLIDISHNILYNYSRNKLIEYKEEKEQIVKQYIDYYDKLVTNYMSTKLFERKNNEELRELLQQLEWQLPQLDIVSRAIVNIRERYPRGKLKLLGLEEFIYIMDTLSRKDKEANSPPFSAPSDAEWEKMTNIFKTKMKADRDSNIPYPSSVLWYFFWNIDANQKATVYWYSTGRDKLLPSDLRDEEKFYVEAILGNSRQMIPSHDYLVQQAKGRINGSQSILEASVLGETRHWLRITRPKRETRQMALSKFEYHLLKTLLQHADYCTEQELIQSAWERGTERANFIQRLYKLRKKLEEQFDGIDIIENRYGGIYSLTHPEWLELD